MVAFDTAGVEDRVRDGVNGFLVKDDGEFEEAVLKLNNSQLRTEMSLVARQRAIPFLCPCLSDRQAE